MRDSGHRRGLGHGQPGSASFLISSGVVRFSDGVLHDVIAPAAVARSQVLVQAQQDASAEACRVPSSFTAEQISLWASYTRMPRVFMTQSSLLHILAVLEVADMLDDAKSVANMAKALAFDYLAPLEAEPIYTYMLQLPVQDKESQVKQQRHWHGAKAKLRARCKRPPAHLGIRHAFLWGAGLSLEGQLREIGPAEAYHCCRAAQASRGHRRSSAAAHSPRAKPDTLFKALHALPEHLLLRVLHAWTAPLEIQLATLPRRLHPAAVTAARPSLDSSRCVSLKGYESFPRALRAVAALGSMRRVDSITLSNIGNHDNLLFAVRRLRHHSAITSLNFTGMPPGWLGGESMHWLSCIAAMPYLCAVGVPDVALSYLPALVATLASVSTCMPQLRELHLGLGITLEPLVADDGWGGAGIARQLTTLTNLEAVKLNLKYGWQGELGDEGVTQSLVPLLRELRSQGKRVQLHIGRYASTHEFSITVTGERCASGVLRTLRAAAPRLDMARCSVAMTVEGSIQGLSNPAFEALWRALTEHTSDADAVQVSMSAVGVGRDIDGIWLDQNDSAAFFPAGCLRALPVLRKLSIACKRGIDRSSAIALAHELPKLTALTALHACECGPRVQPLLPRLHVLTALQVLELADHRLGPQEGESLAAALPALSALTVLLLPGNDFGDSGVKAVMTALAPASAAALTIINLSRNNCGPAGFVGIAARLPEMVSLRKLDLSASVGGAAGIRALNSSPAARRMRLNALTALDLEGSSLECSGAVELAKTLLFLPKLAHLNVISNAIGAAGMRALSRALMRMHQQVHVVLLGLNRFGDAGARALARAIGHRAARPFSGLFSLADSRICCSMPCCGIGDRGALALADAMQAWQAAYGDGREQMNLYCRGNEVTDQGQSSARQRFGREAYIEFD